jgi:hypothetical protein
LAFLPLLQYKKNSVFSGKNKRNTGILMKKNTLFLAEKKVA